MPKIVDHATRRAEIRAAAADAIAEQGLERVRLVDVARRAGCTTGAIGHYFSGKEAVLEAALEHVLGHLVSSALACMEMTPASDPGERLLAALGEVLPVDAARRRDWRVWMAFCGRAAHSEPLASLHREAYEEIQRGLAEALRAHDLAPVGEDAERVAAALMAGIDGVGLRAALEPSNWPAAMQRETLALLLGPLLRLDGAGPDRATRSSPAPEVEAP